ncbi:uncharacterized protein LOC125823359 [Solanum verrucosum]|uniref:uncharacterized protein LOC125823359 n=1 Tax=Solanum verrucosum TaxID=315347 RepID=UPI0020D0B63F|nr:uncharacterized protein LOC125823359 [Solanum verrucosum]
MNTLANPRKVEEENVDGGVSPQGLQGDQFPIGNQDNELPVGPPAMTNEEIRAAFLTLAQATTTQANRDVGPRVNANESTAASRLRDFVRMNPSIFLGSRIGEDPQGFLDEIYKIVDAMGVSSREKAELASYQLKEVAQIWYTQWKENRPEEAVPIEWEKFKEAFLGKYFPLEKRECKIEEFINLRQGNMSVDEYEDQGQPRFKKRAPNQDFSSAPKVNHEGGAGSQISKPTYSTCGKKHFGKCLSDTSGCYGCGKNDHKVRDCPNIVAKGRNARQAPHSGPSVDGQARNHFYALQANKEANPDEGAGKS